MWWTLWFPRRQQRTMVPELASPPSDTATMGWSATGSDESTAIATAHPPSGLGPATERSPPTLTSTPDPVDEAM